MCSWLNRSQQIQVKLVLISIINFCFHLRSFLTRRYCCSYLQARELSSNINKYNPLIYIFYLIMYLKMIIFIIVKYVFSYTAQPFMQNLEIVTYSLLTSNAIIGPIHFLHRQSLHYPLSSQSFVYTCHQFHEEGTHPLHVLQSVHHSTQGPT